MIRPVEGAMKKEEFSNETTRTKAMAAFSSFIILPSTFEVITSP
jgi:hypothetical protein